MRIALYARFSSDLQNPTSAQDQVRDLTRVIERQHPDWSVVTSERDEAVSGTSLNGRSGLMRLLDHAALHPRPFDAVVVEDVSRLARNRSDAVRIRDRFAAAGVQVLSAADGFIDPESEGGMFMTALKEAKAEVDSRETGRRTRRGVVARTEQGWLSGRRIPFGYEKEAVFSETEVDGDGREKRLGVTLRADPVRAEIVTQVFKRYATGVGLRRIASDLNQAGSSARAAKPEGYATSFLRSMLLNPVYLGHVVYGRTKEVKVRERGVVKRRKIDLPSEEWTVAEDQHEALVDQETWDAVQRRFRENKRIGKGRSTAKGGRRPASVLSGLIRCAACGHNFVVWASGPNTKQRKRGAGRRNRRCCCSRARQSRGELCDNQMTVSADLLEEATLDAIEQVVLTPEGLADLERQRAAFLREALEASNEDGERLRAEARRLDVEEARIVGAIRQGIALDGLQSEARRIAERRGQIQGALASIEALEEASKRRVDDYLQATPVQRFRDVLDAPDLDEVRDALKDLIVGIEAREDGSFWLLVGEGPLGTDDLSLIASPVNGDRDKGARIPERSPPPGQPSGPTRGSRICMVGATGLEPATS